MRNFVNGEYVNGSGKEIVVSDKYTKEEIAIFNELNQKEVEFLLDNTSKSFELYKGNSIGYKSEKLERLISLFEKEKESFVELIIKEAGKPRSYAESEVSRCIDTMKIGLRELYSSRGEMINMDYGAGKGKIAFTKLFPIGPILAISPFNFPLNLALHKIIPALITGCSIAIKPSPYAPLSLMKFAELIHKAGFPEGLVNVFLCDNKQSEFLVRSEVFKLFSFTGSPEIGWYLKSISGKKKVTLELGGDSAVYIDNDSDLKEAAQKIAVGSYLYAGQICISTQRVIVHADVYDQFKSELISNIDKIKTGNPQESEVIVGPLIDKVHYDRIMDWVEEAKKKGAKNLIDTKSNENKCIISPILLENVSCDSKIRNKEVFGPCAYLLKVNNRKEAIREINNSKFGLQAGLFTKDINFSKDAFNQLDVGAVLINNIPGFRMDGMPYGGVKDSGVGREGLKYAIDDMSEMKLMVF